MALKIHIRCWLAFVAIALAVSSLHAEKPIAIGSRLEPLVDEFLIDRLEGGARLQLHKPTAREISIRHDAPWEGGSSGYHTVFQDGLIYRMYYRGFDLELLDKSIRGKNKQVICYAESKDGIHWVKPELGLVESGGSKKNNIIWDGDGSHNFAPFIDANPDCKPEAKYKALGGVGSGLYTFQSADGIHWKQTSAKPVITKGAFDSQNLAFWDVTRNRYVAYFRFFTEGKFKGKRAIATTTSTDFATWTEPQPLVYPGMPEEQLYTNQVTPYHRAPHIFFGFPTRYVARPLTEHVKTLPPVEFRSKLIKSGRRYGTDLTDGVFMSSRDGLSFKRWGEAFIRPGPQEKEAWLYGDQYQSWGLVETKSDVAAAPNEISFYSSEGGWRSSERRMRRYTVRLDGFVSVNAPLSGGTLVTKPITFAGDRLKINYATSAAGSIRVEIQDADGKPIEGFALKDCPEIYGDTVAQVVHWKAGAQVTQLAGRPIRLKFVMKDADLYSLRFTAGEKN